MKRFVVLCAMVLAGTVFLLQLNSRQAEAQCTVLAGRCILQGYYTNVPDAPFGEVPVIQGGFTGITNAPAFIARVQSLLFADPSVGIGCAVLTFQESAADSVACNALKHQAIGAGFEVNLMMGHQGTEFGPGGPGLDQGIAMARAEFNAWRAVVQYYEANGWINWTVSLSLSGPNIDTYGDGDPTIDTGGDGNISNNPSRDIFFDMRNWDGTPYDFIIFNNPDGTQYRITKFCGNPAGQINKPFPPIVPPSPSITCTVDPIGSVAVGQLFNVRVTVTLNGTVASGPVVANATVVGVGVVSTAANINPGPNTLTLAPQRSLPTTGTYTINASVSGTISGTPVSTVCSGSVVSGQTPFMKVTGGDLQTGGIFKQYDPIAPPNACDPAATEGYVKTYATTNGDIRGSFSGFEAVALRAISGMFTAGARDALAPNPKPITGLTFSNDPAAPGTDPVWGGAFGGNGFCITPFYDVTQDATLPHPVYNLAGQQSNFTPNQGKIQYVLAPGNYTIGQFEVKRGTQAAVYIQGDVYIDESITYDTTSARPDRTDIPFLGLIVKGNIYIGWHVSKLEGLYVAQPDPARPGSGKVYTCTPGAPTLTSLYAAVDLDANCGIKRLRISGALIAKEIHFLRTHGGLDDPANPIQGCGGGYCSDQGSGEAAEAVLYSPEMFLAPFPFKPPAGYVAPLACAPLCGPGVPYDVITNLPPIY